MSEIKKRSIEIQYNPARRGYDIWFIDFLYDGAAFVGKNIVMEKIQEGESLSEPTLFIPDQFETIQKLFDQLWNIGFRPTENKDNESALKYHLEDMRKIAFTLMEKNNA
jgi:hypothetical protein